MPFVNQESSNIKNLSENETSNDRNERQNAERPISERRTLDK